VPSRSKRKQLQFVVTVASLGVDFDSPVQMRN